MRKCVFFRGLSHSLQAGKNLGWENSSFDSIHQFTPLSLGEYYFATVIVGEAYFFGSEAYCGTTSLNATQRELRSI